MNKADRALPEKPPADFGLTADSDLRIPACRFFLQEFAHVRAHENGIPEDRDTEFTHQYRVGLRRCRALTGLLKDLFEPGQRKALKAELKLIMQKTNLLRDIDVFLERADEYHSCLTGHSQGLSVFFAHLLQTREHTHQELCSWLGSEQYLRHCQSIHQQFKQLEQSHRPALNTSQYAKSRIWRYFTRIVKEGETINQLSADEQFHALRIQCKKLRYLLEFFRPVFNKDKAELQIKALKRLQNQLGYFNDTSTQLQFFNDYLRHHPAQTASHHAISLLTKLTREEHENTRHGVLVQVEKFINQQSQSSFRSMYAPGNGS